MHQIVTWEKVQWYYMWVNWYLSKSRWAEKGTKKCGNESYVHTSVLVSVRPAAPVRVPSCFCWVRLELADPDDALWESEGCSTGIWLWTWLWACGASWHGFLLSSWAAVVAVPGSDPFWTGEGKTAGWVSWADGTSSGWLTWACWTCYKRQTRHHITLRYLNMWLFLDKNSFNNILQAFHLWSRVYIMTDLYNDRFSHLHYLINLTYKRSLSFSHGPTAQWL